MFNLNFVCVLYINKLFYCLRFIKEVGMTSIPIRILRLLIKASSLMSVCINFTPFKTRLDPDTVTSRSGKGLVPHFPQYSGFTLFLSPIGALENFAIHDHFRLILNICLSILRIYGPW